MFILEKHVSPQQKQSTRRNNYTAHFWWRVIRREKIVTTRRHVFAFWKKQDVEQKIVRFLEGLGENEKLCGFLFQISVGEQKKVGL